MDTLLRIMEVCLKSGLTEQEAIRLIGTFVEEVEEVAKELDDMPSGMLN